jgi:hypothetical protein
MRAPRLVCIQARTPSYMGAGASANQCRRIRLCIGGDMYVGIGGDMQEKVRNADSRDAHIPVSFIGQRQPTKKQMQRGKR